MPDIVGVRFKRAGKVYYFEPSNVELKVNDYVVVQTARGIELGQITLAPKQVLASEITAELKPIVRKASEEDIKRAQDFAGKESHALEECTKMIKKLNLHMKLILAEYNLDGGRLTFYFTAEERVDFRELVRELTAFFRTRIELRQIGPRDQAKMVGGLGRCGRGLCCGSFLTEFNPVSIKMAKEQDLPLDPMKISGICGRLQCCLAYESAQYREAKALLPKKGLQVNTPEGVGIVIGGNPIKETVLIELESKATVEFTISQITIIAQPPGLAAGAPDGALEESEEATTGQAAVPEPAQGNLNRPNPPFQGPKPKTGGDFRPAEGDAKQGGEKSKPASVDSKPVADSMPASVNLKPAGISPQPDAPGLAAVLPETKQLPDAPPAAGAPQTAEKTAGTANLAEPDKPPEAKLDDDVKENTG